MINIKMISVVIPTYKEAINIPSLVRRISIALDRKKIPFEIIIVDDNSCDGIEDVVKRLNSNDNIQLIVRKDKRGLSSAVIDGIKYSKSDVIVVMDGDLSHPPEKLPELVDQIANKNADFTIGSRSVKGGSSPHFNFYRKMNALISKLLALPLTKVKDPMAGFFAFRRSLISNIDDLNPLGFKIGLEIIVKTSPRKISEIPITFEERLGGESKLNLK